MAESKTLSKKTLLAVVCFSLLEAAVLLVIFLKFYPYTDSDGSNMFGSVLALPPGAAPDSIFLVIELVAAILPLSVVTALLIILDVKKKDRGGGTGGGVTKL